jgi:transcriptional regulator with XRE-family HTH domain
MYKNMQKMNNIGLNIRKLREKRGYSQDFMANKLDITQASYARIENENIKLSVERLGQIAEVLEADISDFFKSVKLTIQTQTNKEGAYGNGYVENLHIENKEIYEKLLVSKDEQIALLQSQIAFLQKMVAK